MATLEQEKIIKCLESKLKDMNEKLLASESFKQTFIANLKNEIFDPISTIFVVTRDLQRGAISNDELPLYLDLLYKDTLDIFIKLSNIFLMADFEAGEVRLNAEQIDLEKLVNDIRELLDIKFKEKNIKFEAHLIGDKKTFKGDAEKIRVLLINLLANSIFYSPEESTVSLFLWITDKHLNLVITDKGEDFDEQEINRNFTEILNLMRDLSMKSREKTLSFSVTKMIIELMAGKIIVTQREDHTFIALFIPELEIEPEISSTGAEFFFEEGETF